MFPWSALLIDKWVANTSPGPSDGSWDPPADGVATLGYWVILGLRPLLLTSAPPTPMLCPKTSLLFLPLAPYQNWPFPVTVLLLCISGTHLPRPSLMQFKESTRRRSCSNVFSSYTRFIAHVDIHHHPHSLPVSQELSSSSWPYQNWLCSSDCVCGVAL